MQRLERTLDRNTTFTLPFLLSLLLPGKIQTSRAILESEFLTLAFCVSTRFDMGMQKQLRIYNEFDDLSEYTVEQSSSHLADAALKKSFSVLREQVNKPYL